MDRPLKEIVYSPDSELLSFGKLLRSMWSDLLASRELAWRLLVRNISAQYRQSLLGAVPPRHAAPDFQNERIGASAAPISLC
jgi:lipopolysaccharide transport system permease protein